jgi:hypothetical protein
VWVACFRIEAAHSAELLGLGIKVRVEARFCVVRARSAFSDQAALAASNFEKSGGLRSRKQCRAHHVAMHFRDHCMFQPVRFSHIACAERLDQDALAK